MKTILRLIYALAACAECGWLTGQPKHCGRCGVPLCKECYSTHIWSCWR